MRATIWVAANTYLSTGVTFVTSILMARILLPEYYGIFGLSIFFLEAVGRVRELGFHEALIHKQDNLEKAFTTQFVLETSVYVLAFIASLIVWPILSKFYDPFTVKIFVILSAVLIVHALGCTQRIFLEKELAFGKTSLVDFLSLLFASLLGIGTAYAGWGVWSLVLLKVSNLFFVTVGLWLLGQWRPKFFEIKSLDKQMIKWFLKFGATLWVGGTVTFILYKYNDWVLGTFLGVVALGYYTKALSFAQMPTSLVTSIVSKVAFPTYAKVQSDLVKLSRAFNLVLSWILRLSVPISLVMFLTAREFTLLLIGEQWLPMVPIFQMLIIYSLVRPIFDDTGAFLTAIGKPKLMTQIIAWQAALLVLIAPIAVWKWQALGGAAALNFVMLVGIVLAYSKVNNFIKVDFKRSILPTLAVFAFTLSLFYYVTHYFSFIALSLLWLFITRAVLVGFLYLSFTALFEYHIIKQDLQYLKVLFPKLKLPKIFK